MCHEIEARLEELRERRRELVAAGAPQRIKVVIEPGGGAGGQDPESELKMVEAQIEVQKQALANCRAQMGNPVPRPVTATVRTISCDIAKREAGKEEPYLIVAAIDMLAALVTMPPPLPPIAKPAVNTFLYGPYLQFKPGTRRDLDADPFWDLNRQARTIATPQDAAFVVALVENDGSSPDAIRGAVNSGIEVAIVNGAQLAYATLVTNMRSATAGAIDSAGVAGLDPLHLNADDRIGPAQHLELTQDDLDHLYGFGTLDRTLVFERTKNNDKVTDRWRVTFRFEV